VDYDELESEHPSFAKKLSLRNNKEIDPMTLSHHQLKILKGSPTNKSINHNEDDSMKLLSDFLDKSNAKVLNKDVGLGQLDPNYKPSGTDVETNKIRDVLEEVIFSLPKSDIDSLKRLDPLLNHSLKKFVDPKTNTLSKNLEDLPIK